MMRTLHAAILLAIIPGLGLPARNIASQAHKVITLQQQGGRLDWSHVTNLIAFDHMGLDGYFDVYTMRPDGTGRRCLTHGKSGLPQKNNGQPAWHPSGVFIVFQAQDPGLEGVPPRLEAHLTTPGAGVQNNIWIMKSDGSRFWQVTRVKDRHGVLHPHFSPDGTMLIWSELISNQGGGIVQWAVKVADFTVVAGRPVVTGIRTWTPLGLQFYETHGFSPDGRKILFSGVPQKKTYYDMEIFVMDLTTRVTRPLTLDDEWDEHAHFTADGRHIVWASSEGIPQLKGTADPKLDYWVMKADGTGKRRLTGFNDPRFPEYVPGGVAAADFDWGPDGMAMAAYLVKFRGQQSLDNPTVRIDGVTGIFRYGRSTPACAGPIPMHASGFPMAGEAGFTVGCTAAPPRAAGILFIGFKPSLLGIPLLGVRLHIDPTVFFLAFPVASDGMGMVATPLLLPRESRTIRFYAQYVWLKTGPCKAGILSASDALDVLIQ